MMLTRKDGNCACINGGCLYMWKDIKGYEGYYQINENGEVKSLERLKGCVPCKEKILKHDISEKFGYERVTLSKNDVTKRFLVHRLVYETFIGKIPKGYHVNHMDCNRHNNSLSNLEIVTAKENNRKKTNTKVNKGMVIAIRSSDLSCRELAELYDIAPRTVLHIKKKTRWSDI